MNIRLRNIDLAFASHKPPTAWRYFIASAAVQYVYWMPVWYSDQWYTQWVQARALWLSGRNQTQNSLSLVGHDLLERLNDEHPFA